MTDKILFFLTNDYTHYCLSYAFQKKINGPQECDFILLRVLIMFSRRKKKCYFRFYEFEFIFSGFVRNAILNSMNFKQVI